MTIFDAGVAAEHAYRIARDVGSVAFDLARVLPELRPPDPEMPATDEPLWRFRDFDFSGALELRREGHPFEFDPAVEILNSVSFDDL
jgi:hypothetical protein